MLVTIKKYFGIGLGTNVTMHDTSQVLFDLTSHNLFPSNMRLMCAEQKGCGSVFKMFGRFTPCLAANKQRHNTVQCYDAVCLATRRFTFIPGNTLLSSKD